MHMNFKMSDMNYEVWQKNETAIMSREMYLGQKSTKNMHKTYLKELFNDAKIDNPLQQPQRNTQQENLNLKM